MLRWIPYAFIRITFFFILGILSAIYLGSYLDLGFTCVLLAGLGLLFLISKLLFTKKHFYSLSWVQGVFAFVAIFFTGYLNLNLQNDSLREDHLLHLREVEYYRGVVNSPPEEKANTYKYDFVVHSAKVGDLWQAAYARIYLYVDKGHPLLKYGDKLLIKGRPDEISKPMNPGEFNYKRFLTFNNIYHQDYLKDNFILAGHTVPNVILEKAYTLRAAASGILSRYIKTERENNIAQALVLGVKDGLDREIENAYAASGAMHVLAVSGLHVGIVYGIVLLLFQPFRKTRLRNWLLALVSLAVLWSYALITGFSPSVLRAVTMFSFIAVATASGRSTNIYNTLAASGCILLVYNPYLIMSVGFQLSFLAVFGIVLIQPRLYRLWVFDSLVLDKIWAITTVSVAAQIATVPLTLLYFHQFPTFFLVSNLAVIPGAFLILCMGMLLLAVSPVGMLAEWVGWLLQKIIGLVNYVVFHISKIPYSQVTDIEISTWQAWLLIAVVATLLFFFVLKKFRYLPMAFFLVLLFSGVEWQQTLAAEKQHKITIYRVNKHTAIDFTQGMHSKLYTDSVFRADSEGVRFHIRPNRLYSAVLDHKFIDESAPCIASFEGFTMIRWSGINLLIVNKMGKDFNLSKPLVVDYILLAGGFDKDAAWINKNFKYKKIILDGSLRWYLVDELKSTLDSLQMDYYSVYHAGALTLDLNE